MEVNLVVSDAELDLVMRALMAQPWGTVNNLINKLGQQVQAQQQAMERAKANPIQVAK